MKHKHRGDYTKEVYIGDFNFLPSLNPRVHRLFMLIAHHNVFDHTAGEKQTWCKRKLDEALRAQRYFRFYVGFLFCLWK